MIDTIFILKSARQRQKEAPLLCERELFLSYLLQQGCDPKQVRSVATLLLHVIRIMELQILREIHPEEIIAASERWITDDIAHTTRSVGPQSAKAFSSIATRWFRFHRVLILPSLEKKPYEEMLNQFLDAMRSLRGLTPGTLTIYRINVSRFLGWCTDRNLSLLSISLNHIDQFVDEMRAKGWSAGTVATHCNALRAFFRYAEESGWCRPRICQGILTPRTSNHSACPRGPSWKDVRRLLNYRFGTRPTDLRAEAILCLCSIYGLRSCEIVAGAYSGETIALKRKDLNLKTRKISFGGNGFCQSRCIPISPELAEILRRYLRRKGARKPDSPLFARKDGSSIVIGTVALMFAKLRTLAGISRNDGASYAPRIHDLRSTFAVHRISSWIKHGQGKLLPEGRWKWTPPG